MSAAPCAVGTFVTASRGLPCRVAGIGIWASALGWARVGSGHSLFGPVVCILTSRLGFAADECPRRGLGEYCVGGVRRPVGRETGVVGGGFRRADCVTGGGICGRGLDGPAPGVVLVLFSRLIRRDSSIARRMFCASSSSSESSTLVVGTRPVLTRALSNPSVRPQL
jgi:hypothetical protein